MKNLSEFIANHYIYLIYGIILVSPLIDYRLYVWNSEINYIRISIILFNFIFLIYLLINKISYKNLKFDKLFTILISYTVFKLISLIFASNKIDFLSNFAFWANISVFYLFIKQANLYFFKNKIKDLIIISGAINAIFALVQAWLFFFYKIQFLNIYGWDWPTGFRVTGLSFDANHLASFVLLPAYLSIEKLFNSNLSLRKRLLYLISFFMFGFTFYLSASRSAFLGIILSILIIILYKEFSNKIAYKLTLALGSLILVGFMTIGIVAPYLVKNTKSNEAVFIDQAFRIIANPFVIHARGLDSSALAHFTLIHSSFFLMDDNYYFGAGAGNFAEGIKRDHYLSGLFESVDPTVFEKKDFPAHSMYGEALGEGGLIGFMFFVCILVMLLHRYSETEKKFGREIYPYLGYISAMLLFVLFYNLNEEFFWLFVFCGIQSYSISQKGCILQCNK